MSRKHKKRRWFDWHGTGFKDITGLYKPKPDNPLWDSKEITFTEDNTMDGGTLVVPTDIWLKWQYINAKMGNKEWGAVFDVKDGAVSNLRIPKQEVTGGSCIFLEDIGGNGHVHSHHSMGAFNSGTDDHSTRNMFDYAIVLSGYDYVCYKRLKVSETAYKWIPVKLILPEIPTIDLSNIQEKKWENTQHNQCYIRGYDEPYGHSSSYAICRNCKDACMNCNLFKGNNRYNYYD